MKFRMILVAVLLAFFSTNSFACQFDTDCNVGSKCVKQYGKLNGYCAKGMNPGNNYDKKPYRDSLDISGKIGNTCSFDTECGVGNRCYKQSGNLKGVCVKRR